MVDSHGSLDSSQRYDMVDSHDSLDGSKGKLWFTVTIHWMVRKGML